MRRAVLLVVPLVLGSALAAAPAHATAFAPAPTVHVKGTSTKAGLTRLTTLNVGPLKPGTDIRVVCQSAPHAAAGTTCPFHVKELTVRQLTKRLPLVHFFGNRALAPGTQIAVEAMHVAVYGTNVLVTTRAGAKPRVQERCTYPYPCPAPLPDEPY